MLPRVRLHDDALALKKPWQDNQRWAGLAEDMICILWVILGQSMLTAPCFARDTYTGFKRVSTSCKSQLAVLRLVAEVLMARRRTRSHHPRAYLTHSHSFSDSDRLDMLCRRLFRSAYGWQIGSRFTTDAGEAARLLRDARRLMVGRIDAAIGSRSPRRAQSVLYWLFCESGPLLVEYKSRAEYNEARLRARPASARAEAS